MLKFVTKIDLYGDIFIYFAPLFQQLFYPKIKIHMHKILKSDWVSTYS